MYLRADTILPADGGTPGHRVPGRYPIICQDMFLFSPPYELYTMTTFSLPSYRQLFLGSSTSSHMEPNPKATRA